MLILIATKLKCIDEKAGQPTRHVLSVFDIIYLFRQKACVRQVSFKLESTTIIKFRAPGKAVRQRAGPSRECDNAANGWSQVRTILAIWLEIVRFKKLLRSGLIVSK